MQCGECHRENSKVQREIGCPYGGGRRRDFGMFPLLAEEIRIERHLVGGDLHDAEPFEDMEKKLSGVSIVDKKNQCRL